jgi:hypothetical protein
MLIIYVNGVLDSALDIGEMKISQNSHAMVLGLKDQTSNSECRYAIKNFELYN